MAFVVWHNYYNIPVVHVPLLEEWLTLLCPAPQLQPVLHELPESSGHDDDDDDEDEPPPRRQV